MKVKIEYYDNDSISTEEIVRQAQQNYGKNVKVVCEPLSWIAHDSIYFGLQQLVTHRQASAMHDKNGNYQEDIKHIRNDVLATLDEILSQVIIDNEDRLT